MAADDSSQSWPLMAKASRLEHQFDRLGFPWGLVLLSKCRPSTWKTYHLSSSGAHQALTSWPICVDGWGGRIRTSEWRYQKPLPYHLATPHRRKAARCLDAASARCNSLFAPADEEMESAHVEADRDRHRGGVRDRPGGVARARTSRVRSGFGRASTGATR